MSQTSEEIGPEEEWREILGETCSFPIRAGCLQCYVKFYVKEEVFREAMPKIQSILGREIQSILGREINSRKFNETESDFIFRRFWLLLKEFSIKYKMIGEMKHSIH